MTADTKQKVQLVLAIAIAVAAIRTGYILYDRHEANLPQAQKAAPPLNADYYVTPKKLHAYDLKSARDLIKQPVWVKVGYEFAFFPYNPAGHRTDFAHEAGFLLPLEKSDSSPDPQNRTVNYPNGGHPFSVTYRDGKAIEIAPGSAS